MVHRVLDWRDLQREQNKFQSGYNLRDADANYQYHAFGVPGLGFKRGLADDSVVAPYATAMALMVDPKSACANLQRLAHESRLGEFGFYEAVDYTPSRLPPGQSSVTVKSYMVHHQGMAFLSLAYLLLDRPMQRRFVADPAFRATELLLQACLPPAILGTIDNVSGSFTGVASFFIYRISSSFR